MASSDFSIVVVGASAGGIGALQGMVANLPADLSAAIFVVLHIPPGSVSHLHDILASKGPLPALQAHDGEEIKSGHIYVATPDHHLLVDGDRVCVKKGPKENRFRPSIDALFRSAAYSHGTKAWCCRVPWTTAPRDCGASNGSAASLSSRIRKKQRSIPCR